MRCAISLRGPATAVNGRHFLQRALAVDVEQAQAVDFIVKKIEAVGLVAAHREQIELMQRVCPHSFLHGHALVMKKGQRLSRDALRDQLGGKAGGDDVLMR
jgi:transcription-repair coupling factor (superfamily II helicase)